MIMSNGKLFICLCTIPHVIAWSQYADRLHTAFDRARNPKAVTNGRRVATESNLEDVPEQNTLSNVFITEAVSHALISTVAIDDAFATSEVVVLRASHLESALKQINRQDHVLQRPAGALAKLRNDTYGPLNVPERIPPHSPTTA